jgi:hypothetical protein
MYSLAVWHLCANVLGVMVPFGHLVTTATDRRFFPDFGLGVITFGRIINVDFDHGASE